LAPLPIAGRRRNNGRREVFVTWKRDDVFFPTKAGRGSGDRRSNLRQHGQRLDIMNMQFANIKSAIYRQLGAGAFRMARRGAMFGRYFSGMSYDLDYRYVRSLPPGCLIVDIGANAGQSALEFASLHPDARIVSFEPNPDSAADLSLVARVLGNRFAWHPYGLSEQEGEAVLRMPVVGRTPVPGEASLEGDVLADAGLEERIGRLSRVIQYRVVLRTFDSFALTPALVKLDVQGHEVPVLKGMRRTIEAHAPVLLIERSENFEEVAAYLREIGYATFQYDHANDRLERTEDPRRQNFFALLEQPVVN
jgi:FkbM family methyltransferase